MSQTTSTTTATTTATAYFVVSAPGHYGDRSRVWSAHRTLKAAKKAASGGGLCVRVGALTKGDEFLRVYEETYPLAD